MFIDKLGLMILLYFFSSTAWTHEPRGWEAPIGGLLELGRLGSSDMSLQERTMSAVSFQALPGYRFNEKWLFGASLNYRFTQQQTPLSDAGGTNLAGRGWTLGIGAQRWLNERLNLQAVLSFIGQHQFEKQTSQGQSDHLQDPLGLQIQAQYFYFDHLPVSLDFSANLTTWRTFHVSGADNSKKSNQWLTGIGLTYHFASSPSEKGSPNTVAMALPPSPSLSEELSRIVPTEKTPTGIKTNFQGDGFLPYRSDMTDELKGKISSIVAILIKNPDLKIHIRGYTDTSGSAAQNLRISKERAEAVRRFLTENGVSASRLSATGMGSANPIADNKTKEGRAQNRRIEIELEGLK